MANEANQKKSARLLSGDVSAALREMSVPMLFGMIALIVVNLIDTFWVSRLGTEALAAMTFTFPVEAVVINIALGLMIGTSVAVARAVGAGEAERARRLTTDASILAVGIVVAVSALGLLFQRELFTLMGAEGALLDDVQSYMTPWFIGVAFLVVPMIGNGALRAIGDARTPMRMMIGAAVINAVLDPIFIFGFGPVPALGLQGAAIATVIARFITMLFMFVVMLRKTNLLGFSGMSRRGLLDSWWQVGRVAGPAMVTNAVGPFAVGIITAMVARHGPAALAAWGIGARVDAVLLMTPRALSGAVSPFVGQNYSAHLQARVSEGLRRSLWFVVIFGAGAAAALMLIAPAISGVFSDDPEVGETINLYLRTIPVGYAFIGAVAICSSAFNAVDRATRSTVLSILRSLVFAVPLAILGDTLGGLLGLFLGLVTASVLASLLGVRWMRGLLYPFGERPAEASAALSHQDLETWLNGERGWSGLTAHLPELEALDNLKFHVVRGKALGLFVGARELLHLSEGGVMNVPLPVEIGENLVRLSLLSRHPDHEHDGWYRFKVTEDFGQAVWLVGLSHLLYALSQRGADDPITQKELDAYTRSPQCVTAMRAAATRWEELGAAT